MVADQQEVEFSVWGGGGDARMRGGSSSLHNQLGAMDWRTFSKVFVHVPVFGRVESESEGGGAWLKRGHHFHFYFLCSFYFIPFLQCLTRGQ